MTANKKITYQFLDSYFLESNNQINIDYLLHMIMHDYIDNDEKIHNIAIYSSMKGNRNIISITHECIMLALNNEIKFTDFNNYYVSSAQLKSWLNSHCLNWSVFQPVADYIIEERKIYNN